MGFENLQLPSGPANQQLYSWANQHVLRLRQIAQSLSTGTVDLTVIEADIDDLQARVTALEMSGGGTLTPQQVFQLDLTVASDEQLGSISYIEKLRKTRQQEAADAAIAAAINANRANTGVLQEVRVRAEQDFSLAQQIDSVTAELGVTNASVTALTTAVSDGDSALGSQITSVQSQVAGNTASIVVLTESVDGVQTRFAVTLNAQNEVIGFIRLDGTQQGSNFVVGADNFYVGKAGTTGGTAVPVFAIQNANGVAKLTFRGDMYADGTIVTRHLAADSVTADKINVTTLAALSADLGTVTAGLIRNAANTLRFDLPNMRLYRSDGDAEINLNTKFIRFRA